MKQSVFILLWGLFAISVQAETVLTAAFMLDVNTGKLVKQPYIVMQEDRIEKITTDKNTLPKDAKIIDLGERIYCLA